MSTIIGQKILVISLGKLLEIGINFLHLLGFSLTESVKQQLAQYLIS